jgi:Cu(I)/Ag(I) efflux system membrane fusion protein
MNHNTRKWMAGIAGVALLGIGLAVGYGLAVRRSTPAMAPATMGATAERNALYWYDPMVPDKHFDSPGKSPFMDMQLVPKYADEMTAGGVRIDAGMQQNVGIRVALVEKGRLSSALRVPGTLTWNLRRESVVSARAEGVVTRVMVKAPYTAVQQGQPLALLLAPSWSSALAESAALQEADSPAARELQAAARQRLHALGVPDQAAAKDGAVTLAAPENGVVTEVLAREGETVMPGAPLFRLNSTASLWLEASVPQAEVSALRHGTPVRVQVNGLPGESFSGAVELLLPQVDPASRTQRARIVLQNPRGLLAPGMFAEVILSAGQAPAVPLIPTEALIATGDDSRVIVQDTDGNFRPVRVRIGRSANGRTEILDGLVGGEQVVVSGQFLIDSEASLSGALDRIGSEVSATKAQP